MRCSGGWGLIKESAGWDVQVSRDIDRVVYNLVFFGGLESRVGNCTGSIFLLGHESFQGGIKRDKLSM